MGCEQSVPIHHHVVHHAANKEFDPDEETSLSDIIRKYQDINLSINSDPDLETVDEITEAEAEAEEDERDGLPEDLPISCTVDVPEGRPTKSNRDDAGVPWYNRMPTEVTRAMLDFGGEARDDDSQSKDISSSNNSSNNNNNSYQGIPWYNRMPTGVTRAMLDFGGEKDATRVTSCSSSSSSSIKSNDDANVRLYNHSPTRKVTRVILDYSENNTNDPHDHQGDGSTTSASGTSFDSPLDSNHEKTSRTIMKSPKSVDAYSSSTSSIRVKTIDSVAPGIHVKTIIDSEDDLYDDFSKYNYYAVDFKYFDDVGDDDDDE